MTAALPTSLSIGGVTLVLLSDGEFRMYPDFLTDPEPQRELAGSDGVARLPIGCFLIPGDAPMLIDIGFGPASDELLTGGQLLDHLQLAGYRPENILTIALSHLHPDHVGWLATKQGELIFENAEIIMGAADWRYFVEDRFGDLAAHLRHALEDLHRDGRVRLLDGETDLTRAITAMPTPGHTPGHTVFAIHDRGERALLLGDAVHCPQQLSHAEWGAAGDVDRALAAATREALQRDLERHGDLALGCHFPDLRAIRLLHI
jgi:glyoxylase-like metal-dependent hydrolase (beta-lactamase superfamily II)